MGKKTKLPSNTNSEEIVRSYVDVLAKRFELRSRVFNLQSDARNKAQGSRKNSGETELPPQEPGTRNHLESGMGEAARAGLEPEAANVGTVQGGKVDQLQQSSFLPPEVVSQKEAASVNADFVDRVATEFGLEELRKIVGDNELLVSRLRDFFTYLDAIRVVASSGTMPRETSGWKELEAREVEMIKTMVWVGSVRFYELVAELKKSSNDQGGDNGITQPEVSRLAKSLAGKFNSKIFRATGRFVGVTAKSSMRSENPPEEECTFEAGIGGWFDPISFIIKNENGASLRAVMVQSASDTQGHRE